MQHLEPEPATLRQYQDSGQLSDPPPTLPGAGRSGAPDSPAL